MELTELFQAELDREVARSRRALEQVPEGKADWKPHEKSMIFGYLTEMVATIPTWITMIIKQDELDIAPKEPRPPQAPKNTSAEYLDGARQGRCRCERRTEEHQRRVPEDDVASACGRAGRHGAAAPRDDSRHHQPLGASPRPDDRLSAPDGRQSACVVRSISRRHAFLSRASVASHRGGRGARREKTDWLCVLGGLCSETLLDKHSWAPCSCERDRRTTPAARDRSQANTTLTPTDTGRARRRHWLAVSRRWPAR